MFPKNVRYFPKKKVFSDTLIFLIFVKLKNSFKNEFPTPFYGGMAPKNMFPPHKKKCSTRLPSAQIFFLGPYKQKFRKKSSK
jgi:hypothetical protein